MAAGPPGGPAAGSPAISAAAATLSSIPPEVLARRAILGSLVGSAQYPPTWGARTLHVYAARALLRLAALVCCVVALAIPWWRVDLGAPGASASGSPWWTTTCTASARCTSQAAWRDTEPTLQAGQFTVIVGFLASLALAWAHRLVRRLAPVSAATRTDMRVARLRLLTGEEAWAATALTGGPAPPAPKPAEHWQLRRLRNLMAVDAVTLLFIFVGTVVFIAQTRAWQATFIAPTAGLPTTLTLTAGAHTAIAAVVLAGGCAAITAATLAVQRRRLAAACASPPPPPPAAAVGSSESATPV